MCKKNSKVKFQMNTNVTVLYVKNYIGNFHKIIKRDNKPDMTNVNHFSDDTSFFE